MDKCRKIMIKFNDHTFIIDFFLIINRLIKKPVFSFLYLQNTLNLSHKFIPSLHLLACKLIIIIYVNLGYSILVNSVSLCFIILNHILLLNSLNNNLKFYPLNLHIFAYANNYKRQDENQRGPNYLSYL
jgi:hypothetical protein